MSNFQVENEKEKKYTMRKAVEEKIKCNEKDGWSQSKLIVITRLFLWDMCGFRLWSIRITETFLLRELFFFFRIIMKYPATIYEKQNGGQKCKKNSNFVFLTSYDSLVPQLS